MKELQELYSDLNPNVESYDDRYLKKKLMVRFGPNIHVTDLPGRSVVICFSGTASKILSDVWYQNRQIVEKDEELRVIKTAAAIIRRTLKSQAYDCSQFPTLEQIQTGSPDLIPELLKTLIYEIIKPARETEENKSYRTEKQSPLLIP